MKSREKTEFSASQGEKISEETKFADTYILTSGLKN